MCPERSCQETGFDAFQGREGIRPWKLVLGDDRHLLAPGWWAEVFTLAGEILAPAEVGFPGRAGLGSPIPGVMQGLQRKRMLCCWRVGGRGEAGVEISFCAGPQRSLGWKGDNGGI